MSETQEQGLIYRALGREQAAFEALYITHYPRVYGVIARRTDDPEDAKDLIQLTFMRAFQALGSFRGDAAFSTWLTRIALNVCTTHFYARQQRRFYEVVVETDGHLQTASERAYLEDPAEILHRKQCRRLVLDGIQALREPYRKALWLRYAKDRTYTEITDELNVPLGTVKTWLCRGRRQLAEEVLRVGALPW